MATKNKSTESVYRVTEVIGTSAQSWEEALHKTEHSGEIAPFVASCCCYIARY